MIAFGRISKRDRSVGEIPESFSLKSEVFSEYLLDKAKIAVAPGIFFGKDYDEYIRISFSSSEKDIKEAINRISKIFDTREMS